MFFLFRKTQDYYLVICMLLITGSLLAQQYWISQPCPTTKRLAHLVYTDSSNIWAAGDSGIIIHTSNGGNNWQIQPSGINSLIECIYFSGKQTGWAISNDYNYTGTIILKTSNAGLNWNFSRYPDTTYVLHTIYFLDSLNGFMGGHEGVLLKTSNGGVNWTRIIPDPNPCSYYPILKFNFLNAQTGFASGGIFDIGGVVWRTTNGGLNWKDSCIAAEPLFDILHVSNGRAVTVGGDFEYGASFYQTHDGGISWNFTSLLVPGIAKAISPRTNSEYWVAVNSFLVSTDTTNSWAIVTPPDSIYVEDVTFINQRLGWSVGGKGSNLFGAILKYNPGIIGIEPVKGNVPVNAELFQNYPNPFNPATTIKYSISKKADVKIAIYDPLGKEIFSFNEGMKESGTYSVSFDAGDFASGIYFYKLMLSYNSKEYSIQKKMVLLK